MSIWRKMFARSQLDFNLTIYFPEHYDFISKMVQTYTTQLSFTFKLTLRKKYVNALLSLKTSKDISNFLFV